MPKRFLVLLIGATALTACATDAATPQAETPPPADAEPACLAELDQAFGSWADAGFSGSVAISTGGAFDCVAAYGTANRASDTPNTADTVFSIGSISKAFTAAAIVDLFSEGKLTLDSRAGDLISDLNGPVADATVEQLLVHTSGLTGSHGGDDEPMSRDEAIVAIGRLEQAFPPGSDYLYSNAGYTLLAVIVEEVSGLSYREYMTAKILKLPDGAVAGGFWNGDPAASGPRALGYFDGGRTGEPGDFAGPYWATDGNGSLAMTTPDLATWTYTLFTAQLLSPESVGVITTAGFDHRNGRSETPGWVAFDESVYGEPVLATAGGGGDVGHNVVVAWLPSTERVIAIASNTSDLSAEELLATVAPALVAGEPLPTPAAPAVDVDPADLAAVVGSYVLASGGSFAVTAHDDGLGVSATGVEAVTALFPLPAGYPAEEVAGHEAHVVALLNGETQEGREERAALESSLGPVDQIELGGTVVDDGELRTYVTVTSGTTSLTLWYALNEAGGIEAAEAAADPPTLVLGPSGGGAYRPIDPAGTGPDITVEFENGHMSVSGPAGVTTATVAR